MNTKKAVWVAVAFSVACAAAPGWIGCRAQAGPAGAPSRAEAANPKDPVVNFEHVWRTIDKNYGQFSVKRVDWDALYRVYRPQVTQATTDKELWEILLAMLGTLNDGHVCLADGSRRICAGQNEGRKRDEFSLALVKSKYFQDKSADLLGGKWVGGWLAEGVGYLYCGDFKDGMEPTTKAIDEFMGSFSKARVMVVDVRNNPGGTGRSMDVVAGRFADRRRHYMTVQTRYGPKHDDLWPAEYHNVEPGGPIQFTRPTILLANRASASGADTFVLAMRVLPHVTVVGDVTEGALSAQFPEKLPNGWTLWVAFKVIRDQDGVCWDGVGVPPDIRVCNRAEDIVAGKDATLEFALQLLEKGPPAPHDEASSLANLKRSLVQDYDACAKEKGVEAAVAGLRKARAADDGASFFGPDEAIQQAGQYLGRKQYSEAVGLLQACREAYPKIATPYAMLASAYIGTGDIAAAEAAMKQCEKVEPMLALEPQQIERARSQLRKAKLGSAADVLGKALTDGGIPAAEKALQELIARRETGGPVFDEADFNALGYRLAKENNIESALFVFEKTVTLYPNSWNAWDSLGEIYAKAGRKDRAIESYRKSLELNPKNKNGKAMLDKLEKG